MDYHIDKCAEQNQRISKDEFYSLGQFSSEQKSFYTKQIKRIDWLFSLKEDTVNVAPYVDNEKEFPEIEIFKIELKKEDKLLQMCRLVMEVIPYPMLIELHYNNKIAFAVERQRLNKVNLEKNVVEEIHITDFYDKDSLFVKEFSFKNFRYTNFYEMYYDLYCTVIQEIAKSRGFQRNDSLENVEKKMFQVEKIEEKIRILRSRLKTETQFNYRMTMNIEIKKYQQRIEKIKHS